MRGIFSLNPEIIPDPAWLGFGGFEAFGSYQACHAEDRPLHLAGVCHSSREVLDVCLPWGVTPIYDVVNWSDGDEIAIACRLRTTSQEVEKCRVHHCCVVDLLQAGPLAAPVLYGILALCELEVPCRCQWRPSSTTTVCVCLLVCLFSLAFISCLACMRRPSPSARCLTLRAKTSRGSVGGLGKAKAGLRSYFIPFTPGYQQNPELLHP